MMGEDQRTRFEEDGVLVVPDVVERETLDAVRAEYDERLARLCEGWTAEGRLPDLRDASFEERIAAAGTHGLDWFQPLDISLPGGSIASDTPMFFPRSVFAMATGARLLDLVEALIGPEITSNPIQHVRIKPPAHELAAGEDRAHVAGTLWHQDRGVAHEEADATRMVTVWIAVTDADVENGCLEVVRGAHRDGMAPHCPKRGQLNIAEGHLDKAAAEPVPVPAGGVVVLHPLMPHAALPNRSNSIRWSFDLRYNVTGEPTGRAHFPAFVARSRTRPETMLRDWRAWNAMWEDARARLAATPHIPIHRWSADATACA